MLYTYTGLFVLPSYYEGLPIVLLEAMDYGLSCIASDIQDNRSVGLCGNRFFNVGDVNALAEKIKEFIDKPLTLEEKEKQIKLISDNYSSENIAINILNVYKEVLLKSQESLYKSNT